MATAPAVPLTPAEEAVVENRIYAYRSQFTLDFIKYVIGASIIVLGSSFLAWRLFPPYKQFGYYTLTILLVFLSALGYLWFYHRGLVKTGIAIFSGLFALFVAASMLLIPQMLTAGALCFVLPVLLGHLFLDRKVRLSISLGCTLLLAGDALLLITVMAGRFPGLNQAQQLAIGVFINPVIFAALAMVLEIVVAKQLDSFRQAQRYGLRLEQQAAAEEAQRRYLQTMVEKYAAVMKEIGQGNLAVQAEVRAGERGADDPLVALGVSLNEMAARLRATVAQTRDTATDLSSASAKILAATGQQAAGASEQSAAMAQTSTTINEVRQIADQTTERAQGVAEAAEQMRSISDRGQQAVADTISGITQIKEKVGGIATNILALSEQSQAIGQIIVTVNELATQSNMLALNAAVEAARAGEAGKGFAVVAGEVRSLAEQSRAATVQVRDLLEEIQRSVVATVMATEEGIKRADAGVRLSEQARETIRQLSDSVAQSAQSAAQIAAAAGQQLTGMEQIAAAMQNVYQVTIRSAASAQQNEVSAQQLDQLAGALRQVVQQYQV